MNNNDVKNYLPHRYPFLLIDKVLDFRQRDNEDLAAKGKSHYELEEYKLSLIQI